MILVSACLLGVPCRYDGRSCPEPALVELAARGKALPCCPEVLGGLGVPHPPAEIVGGDGEDVLEGRARVLNIRGQDATAKYLRGAQAALRLARCWGIRRAILKSHSPSCATCRIYDGTFTGRLREGQGVTAALLRREGLELWSGEQWKNERQGCCPGRDEPCKK